MRLMLVLGSIGFSFGILGLGLGVMLLVSALYLQYFPQEPFTYAPYLTDPMFFWWLSEQFFKYALPIGGLGLLLRYIEYRYRRIPNSY